MLKTYKNKTILKVFGLDFMKENPNACTDFCVSDPVNETIF